MDGSSIKLTVNSSEVTLSGTLAGSEMDSSTWSYNYYNWGTLTATIDLVEGENTITIASTGKGFNLDYISITTSAVLSWAEA